MKEILLKTATNHRIEQVLKAIELNNAELTEEEKQAKFTKMAESAFRFYRGTNHLFWADFAGSWLLSLFGNPDTRIWLQGDAHVENMGAYCTHRGDIVFGLNDFDDAVVADYQYDIWRFAISIVLAARQQDDLSSGDIRKVLKHFAKAYLQTILAFESGDNSIYETYFTKENTKNILQDFLEEVEEKEGRAKMLGKWTTLNKGERVFDFENEKLAPVDPLLREKITKAIQAYRQTLTGALNPQDDHHFTVKDVALRLNAGTGSLGVDRYYVLLEGDAGETVDHILDVKQQNRPTPFLFLSEAEKEEYDQNFDNDAERQAAAYIALSDDPDSYLGWLKLDGKWFSVRERSPYKEGFPLEDLKKKKDWKNLAIQWGKVLATEHRRGAKKYNQEQADFFFEQAIQKQVGKQEKAFIKLLTQIAFQYAERVEKDYQFF